MMTTSAACVQDIVSPIANPAQNETTLSDVEILRRVRRIRSTWSVTERIARRQEADKRFASLLDALSLDHSAA